MKRGMMEQGKEEYWNIGRNEIMDCWKHGIMEK
jgi:hypothetical protein